MKKKAVLLCLLSAILISGCGRNTEPVPSESPFKEAVTESATETVAEETEAEEVVSHEGEAISPFTGLWVSKKVAGLRPVAVMTENTHVTLPQYGLSQADVIYECPAEGGITRLMAIYQNYKGMERVGNVRSCRLYYVYFAKEFDAIYFHAGESKYAVPVLDSPFIDNIDGITGKAANYFFRDTSRRAPHNLYTSSDRIKAGIETYGYEKKLTSDYGSHYLFAGEDPVTLADGYSANKVSLYYPDAKPWFEYKESDGLYYRYEFGEPQIDGGTGEQLAVTNILIQNCPSSIIDAKTGTHDIDHKAGGTGFYITGGKAESITWSRESDTAITHYYDMDGNEITLNPGKTWVEICENGSASNNKIE